MQRRIIAVVFALLVAFTVQARGADSSPQYVVIKPQPAPAAVVPAPAERYSYGWFGAAPRKHARRHFGYHRNYTQWSWR